MRDPTIQEVPKQWLPFIGPKLGLARSLYVLSVDPDDFDLHQVLPNVGSVGRLLGHQHEIDLRAGGAGLTLADGIHRSMGELLERYALWAYDGADRIVASYDELVEHGHRPVPLPSLSYFSQKQYRSKNFPYSPFSRTVPLGWIRGTNLLDGRPTYAPVQVVSSGYGPAPDDIRLVYATSSGCAVATSMEEAVLKGLFELIERDAFMIRWYARMAPPSLDLDAVDVLGYSVGRQAERLEIRFHDLTIDSNLPVVGVTCIERTGRPCFFVLSAAADLDARKAARKALLEAGQGRPYVKSLTYLMEPPLEGAEFGDFEANLRFYGEPSNGRYVEWFLENSRPTTRRFPPARKGDRPLQALGTLLDRCDAWGVTPIAFDLTTPEMQENGVLACRVFAPELVPLCVPAMPFFGHPRLAQFIASAAKESTSTHVPDWIPHPFP